MALFDQRNAQERSTLLRAQAEIARDSGPIDASAHNEDIELVLFQALQVGAAAVGLERGSDHYLSFTPDASSNPTASSDRIVNALPARFSRGSSKINLIS